MIDVLSGMNQGGQTSCWAIVCSVKLNRKMSTPKGDKFVLMTLYLLTQFQSTVIYLQHTDLTAFQLKIGYLATALVLPSPNWLIRLFLILYTPSYIFKTITTLNISSFTIMGTSMHWSWFARHVFTVMPLRGM